MPVQQKISLYIKMTAKIAPNCMLILNDAVLLVLSFMKCSAIKRCPVEETGINSVKPSTIPKAIAFKERIKNM